jgi:hypothetical protein
MSLAVVQTAEGPRVLAPGVCAVCGWRGWEQWDVGLKPISSEPGAWVLDEDPTCICPHCTLNEVAVYPGAAYDALDSLPAQRESDDGFGLQPA